MKIFPKCSLLENMGSYVQYALIALGLVLVLGLLYWRWRKVSAANKSLETELKVLQPYHKGPEAVPRPNVPSFPPPRPAAMAKSEAPAFVMPTFSSVLVESSFAPPPPTVPRESSIVELLDEPPSKTPPRLPTPLASLSEDDENDENDDDDIEEGPPPLIERKEAESESASEPAASSVEVPQPVAAGDDPKAAEVEPTSVDEPVDASDSPKAANVTTKGRPGRKPKVKA
jgi:hypothetical protein